MVQIRVLLGEIARTYEEGTVHADMTFGGQPKYKGRIRGLRTFHQVNSLSLSPPKAARDSLPPFHSPIIELNLGKDVKGTNRLDSAVIESGPVWVICGSSPNLP